MAACIFLGSKGIFTDERVLASASSLEEEINGEGPAGPVQAWGLLGQAGPAGRQPKGSWVCRGVRQEEATLGDRAPSQVSPSGACW